MRCRILTAVPLLLSLLLPAPARGQAAPASISGVILDAGGRTAVEGAEITLVGLRRRVVSSALGEFRFDEVPPGFVVLHTTHPGYRERTDTVGLAPGERVEVRLTVSAEAIELEPLNVVARRGTLGAGLTGMHPGMTRSEIERALPRVSNLGDLIQSANVPGLTIRDLALPGEANRICVEHPRARSGRFGQGTCLQMNVYIDGRLSLDPQFALADLPPESIERFEILPPLDAAALYGDAGRWGVILVETHAGSGVAERRLPSFGRDAYPVTFLVSGIGASPADIYDGVAVFTFDQAINNIRYVETTSWRPGVRLGLRARPFSAFPEVEVSGFWVDGASDGVWFEAGGPGVRERHDLRTMGLDVTARFTLTRGARWDLSILGGPVFSWERVQVTQVGTFQRSPLLGARLGAHMSRSWSSTGGVIGADLEWEVHPRASVLVGGRWRALTLGEPDAEITVAQASAGEDLLSLPDTRNRSGRRTLEVGLVLRAGG